ncbi:GAF domain-containing protein [Paenibacillus polymyxa]|jgi:L-methionine (R)-S-oxide reductase|uniref:GAF domain-containing protein n=1 Tax=Paenibacillus TaxID=44249 RepID=UPI00142DC437|nr:MULTISPECIES: GAF domain-containing protein [Paenibacillus]KAF6615204.1 GAF domain-containing protein [Paenibacillus sp. EKM101P]KAF6618806.1 GAF domain-containing protein [Paenibacillus sp. EKM102P]KAF6627173.1 GAF domain-containing protein [Paenibacillus sp. EKM10P]KAF6643563.1 GAF domain-containing protein [Paenibacillus sp. EKM11P]MBY0024231.1 GAF domain-containing protein [Paenibacillus polymyxa]
MFQTIPYEGTRQEQFESVLGQLRALVHDESNRIANLANASALLGHFLPDVNWSGFYLYDGTELVLGPFQGLPACIRIPLRRGVCGTAAAERRTLVIDDVHAFPGHIACDAASNSEIVIPLIKNDELIGVLDIDSPLKSRFDQEDRVFLEEFTAILVSSL